MELKIYPDKVLRVSCRPLRDVTDADAARMREMVEFMYVAEGVGLAAPQVGWTARVVTMDSDGSRQDPRIFINPRIVVAEGEIEDNESCLSLPGVRVPLRRAAKIVVAAYTLAGERIEREIEGWPARIWQHEIDHLNGVLFIDRLDPLTRFSLRQQLKEIERPSEKAREG